jgi:hypothetical protein
MFTLLLRDRTNISVHNLGDHSISHRVEQEVQLELSEKSTGHDARNRGVYWNKKCIPFCGYRWAVDEYRGAYGEANRDTTKDFMYANVIVTRKS